MATSTTNVNSALNKIAEAIGEASRDGLSISTGHHGNIFSCIALSVGINKAINLTGVNAGLKLNALLQLIKVKTKSFLANKGGK